MNPRTTLILALGLLALSSAARSAGELAPAQRAKIDATIKSITDAADRTLGKSATYCTANHLPQGRAMDASLKTYLAAMSTGSREAMLEIAAKDPSFIDSAPVYSGKDFEMMDKQADAILQGVKGSPPQACAKMGTVFDAGTSAYFKEFTQRSYQEYLAKRAQYCARTPKPANCK